MEWVNKNVRSDLRQESTSWSERGKVAVRSAMLYGLETVALQPSGTDEKTGGRDGGGRVEDVTIFIRSDKNGQRNEYIRGTAQVRKFGGKTREERLRWYGHLRRKDDGVYWEMGAEDGVARKEETGMAKKEVYGCGERGHG